MHAGDVSTCFTLLDEAFLTCVHAPVPFTLQRKGQEKLAARVAQLEAHNRELVGMGMLRGPEGHDNHSPVAFLNPLASAKVMQAAELTSGVVAGVCYSSAHQSSTHQDHGVIIACLIVNACISGKDTGKDTDNHNVLIYLLYLGLTVIEFSGMLGVVRTAAQLTTAPPHH